MFVVDDSVFLYLILGKNCINEKNKLLIFFFVPRKGLSGSGIEWINDSCLTKRECSAIKENLFWVISLICLFLMKWKSQTEFFIWKELKHGYNSHSRTSLQQIEYNIIMFINNWPNKKKFFNYLLIHGSMKLHELLLCILAQGPLAPWVCKQRFKYLNDLIQRH